MGGRTIETEAEARSFTAAMNAHPAAWLREEHGPIRVGEVLDMPPCASECPRVELWAENQPAADLVFAALPEHSRALLPAYVEALTAEMGDEAGLVVLRAFRALQSDPVTGWLKAQYATPEDDS